MLKGTRITQVSSFLAVNVDVTRLRRSLGNVLESWSPALASSPHRVYCNGACSAYDLSVFACCLNVAVLNTNSSRRRVYCNGARSGW